MEEEKEKSLKYHIKPDKNNLEKGSIMRFGELKRNRSIEVIVTDILPLDIAVSIDGYPKGRIIEIYGSESFDKTAANLHSMATIQESGGKAAFIDAEACSRSCSHK